jgi:hypothetical protein
MPALLSDQTEVARKFTRLTIEDVEYSVHGWRERDLRAALTQLGVASDRIPAAQPEPRSVQS